MSTSGRNSKENDLPSPELTPELLLHLQSNDRPGNVRELENMIERLVVLSNGSHSPADLMRLDHPPFPFRVRAEGAADDLTTLVRRVARLAVETKGEGSLYERLIRVVDRELLTYVMSTCEGGRLKAARLLVTNRSTLARKLGTADVDDGDQDWGSDPPPAPSRDTRFFKR